MTSQRTAERIDPAPALHARLLRLAASLLRDPHDAADAVAHALATTGQPATGTAARPALLHTAVRRFASNLRRAAWTRRRHETGAARAEAQPSAEELVAREQLRRRVADAVIALPEPYRSTVNLVCLEQIPVAEAARRLGVAEATVRVRLHRARELLRQRLDADYGGRAAWAGLALPLAGAPAAVAWFAMLGGLAAPTGIAAATVLLSAGALTWWSWPSAPLPLAPLHVAAVPSPLVEQDRPHAESHTTGRERNDGAATPQDVTTPATRVLWDDGQPAAGLEFWTWGNDPPSVARPSEGRDLQQSTLPRRHGLLGEDGSLAIRFTPPPETSGPLTVRAAEGVFVTWTELQPVLRLPRLGMLAIALAGAPPGATWDVFAEPVVSTPSGWRAHGEGGELVRAVQTAGGEMLVAVHSLRRHVEGVAATTIPVPDGFCYRVTGKCLGFLVKAPEPPTLAPGSVQLRCVAAVPTLHVRLLTNGGEQAGAPLAIAVETDQLNWHEDSACGEIRCPLPAGARVAVVAAAAGEVFAAAFTAPAAGEQRVDCAQGRGQRTWRLGERAEDDVTGFWWRTRSGNWQEGARCLTAKSPFLLEHEGQLMVHGLEESASQVFVLTANGRVLAGSGGKSGWMTERQLPAPAGSDCAAQLHRHARCTAQLRLPGDGKETWVVLREWRRGADGSVPPWPPTRAPTALDVRLVLHTDRGDTVLPWPAN